MGTRSGDLRQWVVFYELPVLHAFILMTDKAKSESVAPSLREYLNLLISADS
ncbi:MAG: hypothetical protein K2X48_20160 [Chitinophagaceae bacterium]|nr:hypothetical protein [Chitinophagaceae bacterium]